MDSTIQSMLKVINSVKRNEWFSSSHACINEHAFLSFPLTHLCISMNKIQHHPNAPHHLPPRLPSCNLSLSPIHLPPSPSLSLCPHCFPPSYNDLVITGSAVPALVSWGLRGLIETEWVWVCVAVKPHWHRLGSWGIPPYRVFTYTHTHMHVSLYTKTVLILQSLTFECT